MTKRHTSVYVLFSVAAALCLVATVFGFAADTYDYIGIIGAVLFVFAAAALATAITRDNLNIKCGKLCDEKRYAEEKALIEKKMRSPFFFLIRTVALMRYIRVNMALDDLSTAKRYVDRLRHGGGEGWRYMTDFYYILIELDAGELSVAHAEYGAFRSACQHAEIYREQLEILSAVFHRLYQTGNNDPLPQSAVNCPFPVVSRILGRVYEEGAAKLDGVWEE